MRYHSTFTRVFCGDCWQGSYMLWTGTCRLTKRRKQKGLRKTVKNTNYINEETEISLNYRNIAAANTIHYLHREIQVRFPAEEKGFFL
jgi:hypothetical protein